MDILQEISQNLQDGEGEKVAALVQKALDSGMTCDVVLDKGLFAGMQIIGLVFGGESRKEKEIGFYKERFDREFLGIKKDSEIEVYHLHNSYITLPSDFESYSEANNGIVQAMKHNSKEIYGVLFHPEVRNPEIIVSFCKL